MRLSYSLGNEDCRTEHEALKIRPGDKVVCITASGDRPLHLLLADASEVVCVDSNPSQNHLLALKKAALKHLSYEQYLRFLGLSQEENRIEMWSCLRDSLPEKTKTYWDKRYKMIAKGVVYQGNVEKWCKRIAFVFKIFRKEKVEKLFSFRDLDKQREFLKEWEAEWLKKACSLISGLLMPKNVQKDDLYNRVHEYLQRHLAKDSPVLSLALLGEVSKDNLPPYLSRLGAALIRSRLDRLSHEDADILSFLKEQPTSSIDVFSLSDIASYVDEKKFQEILAEMVRTAKQGARFCLRQVVSEQKMPEELQFSLRRDQHLEKRLENEDRTFVYRFLTGTVFK